MLYEQRSLLNHFNLMILFSSQWWIPLFFSFEPNMCNLDRDLYCPSHMAAILTYYDRTCPQKGCEPVKFDECLRNKLEDIVWRIADGNTDDMCR